MKIKKIWIVVIIIILLVIGYYVSKSVFKSPAEGLVTEKVQKGQVLQEISETGSVKATEELNLGFKSIGKVAKIDVAVGNSVKKGDVLAQLDFSQTFAQLQSAQSALNSSQSQYDKLMNGITQEDIKTYQDAVDSAKDDLQSEYDSALNVLSDAYAKIYNAYNIVVALQDDYFPTADQQGIKVSNSKNDLQENLQNVKTYLDKAKGSQKDTDIDLAVSKTLIILDNVSNDMKVVREQCDQGVYYYSVPSADKSSLDDQRTYINTESVDLTTSETNINSYKIALQKAQDNLSLKTAAPRQEDVDVSRAQVQQAQANVNLYQSQLNDNYLISPIDGTITEVNIKKGQVVSSSQSAVSLLSSEPFEIKADIYEQDIVNVKVGNDVKISLVAFPRQTFFGKVLSINPAETIVDNVVYYQVTIELSNQPNGIKSGMTADITIETNKKEDVLRVPKNAVVQIDGKETVQVLNNNKIEDRIIATDLEGNDYYEVSSGLSEGDIIVTGKR